MLVLRWFIIRRRQFAAILHSSASNIDKRRYVRLMLLCCFEILLAWPLALLITIYNTPRSGIQPYTSWDDVHADFYKVWMYQFDSLAPLVKGIVIISQLMTIQIAFAFFAFFGLSSETYGDLARAVERTFGGRKKKHDIGAAKSMHTNLSHPTLNSMPSFGDSKDDDLKATWVPLQTSSIMVTSERAVSM